MQALLAGLGVTSLIQSSTATCLIVISFLGAIAGHAVGGAGGDAGRRRRHRLMAVVFSFDLSWLSPLLIFGGVVAFISTREVHAPGASAGWRSASG